ncbi:ankyrin repeat-containing domain protein [Xylariales sp. AK1849]|nr:ankyrin repeat-containing domain protein [Xylariales sp. AK1849]
MTFLTKLPFELLKFVIQELGPRDVSSLARSCSFLHVTISPILYRMVRDDVEVLSWATYNGRIDTIERLIAAGADTNAALVKNTAPAMETREFPSVHALQDYSIQLMLLEQQNAHRRGRSHRHRHFKRDIKFHNALHIAAQLGYGNVIDLLLRHGADINARSRGLCRCVFMTEPDARFVSAPDDTAMLMPLHLAICSRNESSANLLMSRGASFVVGDRGGNAETKGRITALHCSSFIGDVAMSRSLIRHYNPDIDIKDHAETTPLSWAYSALQREAMEFLLESGADINTVLRGRSLLLDACAAGAFAEALWLLERGADARAVDEQYHNTALHYCSRLDRTAHEDRKFLGDPQSGCSSNRVKLVRALLESGADIENGTPLVTAAQDCALPVMEVLLANGADINARGPFGATPIMAACDPIEVIAPQLWLDTVQFLLDNGASVNKRDSLHSSAFESLCRLSKHHSGKDKIIRLLLQHGTSLDVTVKENESPMCMLFMQGQLDLCKVLIERGAQRPGLSDLRKMIAHAVDCDDAEVVRFVLAFEGAKKVMATKCRLYAALDKGSGIAAEVLLDAGAPHAHVTKTGWSCLLRACRLGYVHVARKLLVAGANPNQFNTAGSTPLSLAILMRSLPLVETLLEHGADAHLVGLNGSSPLDQAMKSGQSDIVEAILRGPPYHTEARDQHVSYTQESREPKHEETHLNSFQSSFYVGPDPI